MKAEEWRRIEELYYQALELPSAERISFLEQSCGEDASLRSEVESLLAVGDDSRPVEDLLGGAVENLLGAEPSAPERFGPYRVIREIGRGGLGTVFLAERDDEHYSVQVAIKLVRRGFDTDDILARLRQERQILARLEHPNITRLIDGGSTPSGQPYLVMEYVDGSALDVYADARSLTTRARVRLMLDVCAAVTTAHRNLIIHRDLKPSNVLVDGDGTVKLLDFGIAQLLDSDAEHEPTQVGQRLLTPEYASPEQRRGALLTTATDIYSLGATLYRLLTGYPPFESPRPQDDFPPKRPSARRISEDVAAKRRAKPRRLIRQLRGDLDNILLRAMAPEPDARYGSVAELAEDLTRFLENRPVRARRPGLLARFGKLVRRNRLASATITLAILSLLAGAATTAWQARKAQRAQAEAKRVSAFLGELLEASSPETARGEVVPVRSILDRGAKRIADELADEPIVQSRLMTTMGRSYLALGLYDQAEDLLRQAMEIQNRLLGEQSPEWALAANNLAGALIGLGDFAQARKLLESALSIQRREDLAAPPDLADTLNNLAIVRRRERKPAEALELFLEALEIYRQVYGESHERPAQVLNNLSVLHRTQGRFSKAVELARQASELRLELLGEDHPDSLNSLENLGRALKLQNEFDEAARLIESVLKTRRRLLGDEHREVAEGLNNLAQVYEKQGRLEEAVPLFREAREIFVSSLGPGSSMAGITSTNLGQALIAIGESEKAEVAWRRSLAIQLELPESAELGRVQESLGDLLCSTRRSDEGESWLRRAIEVRRRVHGADALSHWRIAKVRSQLAICLLEQGRHGEAVEILEQAREAMEERFGADHSRTRTVAERLEAAKSALESPPKE